MPNRSFKCGSSKILSIASFDALADNQRSIAFHRRYGYELVGIQKEIGHMEGKWTDVAILQRLF